MLLLLTQRREEHDDEAAKHGNVITDPETSLTKQESDPQCWSNVQFRDGTGESYCTNVHTCW